MREPFTVLPRQLQAYILVLILTYLIASVLAVPQSRLAVVGLLVLVFASTGLIKPVPSPFGGIIDPNIGIIIVATLLWRTGEVLLGVGVGSFLGLLLFRKNEVWRAAINGAGWGLPAGTATALARLAIASTPRGLIALVIAGVVAVAAYRISNTGIFAVYRRLRFGRPPVLSGWLQTMASNWASQLFSAPLAVVLAAIAQRTEALGLRFVLTAAYMVALPVARTEYGYYLRSQKMLAEIVEAMVRALEGVDPTARAHGERVSKLATETGRRLGMPERAILALEIASRLHDVGRLAGRESANVEEHHTVVGGRVLGRFPDALIAEYVRSYNERWDGKGLPDGKRGAAIPLGARILAAADIYDSATEGLPPFVEALSPQAATSHLISLAGTVLDPKVVMTVLRVTSEQRSELGATG